MCTVNNLTVACGKKPGGTKAFVYLIPSSEITTFPARKTSTGAGDTVTLAADFTLSTTVGKGYWRKYEIDADSGQLVAEPVGDGQAGGFKNRFSGFLRGIAAAQKEALNNLVGTPVVAIVPDRNGEYHVVGDKDDPAYLASGGGVDSGTTIESKSGIAFTIEASHAHIAPTHDVGTYPLDVTPAT